MWQWLSAGAHPNNRTAKPERPARSAVEPHEVKAEAPTTEQLIGAVLVSPAAGNGTLGALTLDRKAARGAPPSTWLNVNSKIEYADAHGSDQETSDVCLDHCPDGIAMNTEDAGTVACWHDRCVVELAGS